MTDAGPVPAGELPDGWVSAGSELEFESPSAGITVCADRRTDGATAEMAGVPGAWCVWCERRIGEATDRRTVGTVTTRDAAVDGLLSCMRRISDERDPDAPQWASLATLVGGISLRDPVRSKSERGVDPTSYARSWDAELDADE